MTDVVEVTKLGATQTRPLYPTLYENRANPSLQLFFLSPNDAYLLSEGHYSPANLRENGSLVRDFWTRINGDITFKARGV